MHLHNGQHQEQTFYNTGNVGIGTNNPSNILQVGDGGRLKISSGIADFTLIGTKDNINDNTTNTKIFLSSNTSNNAGTPGSIQYFATGTGGHFFYNGTTERMRINASGFVGVIRMTRNVIYKLMELEISVMVVLMLLQIIICCLEV
jgi:hypothetical protein